MYIHQNKDWPNFSWDNDTLLPYVSEVRDLQGRLIGRMEGLGFELREEAVLETLGTAQKLIGILCLDYDNIE